MNKITIKDIAEQLGLSASTVSRAITNKSDVNEETKKLILEKADELHYRPNVISRGLRSNQSFSVGVVVPELMTSFFAEALSGINTVLRAHNYQTIICQSDESAEREKTNVDFLISRHVDGIIISCTNNNLNSRFYQDIISSGIPIVFFNRVCKDVNAPKVIIDDKKWAFSATEHMIKQGCRRIVHFTGPENISVSENRKEGYLEALKEYGIPFDSSLIIPCGISLEDGQNAAKRILRMKRKPDGLFTTSDASAIGAMKELMKAGWHIPNDIAVVGFSESKLAKIIEPNLTSVEQPTRELGASAARVLLEWLSSKKLPVNQEIKLDAQLNIRESSLFRLKNQIRKNIGEIEG